MRIRRSGLIMGVIIGLFWLTQAAWAGHVRLSLDIGFGGYVVPGRWTPLRITLVGLAEPSSIEIRRHNRPGLVEYYPCPASTDGSVVLECPVYADPTGEIFNVRLVTNGQTVAEQEIKTFDKIFPGHIVLTVQTPAPIRQAISQVLLPGEPVMVVAIDLSKLPTAIADYDSIGGVVIADPDLVINPAQKRAIRIWLSGGGRMLVTETALAGNFDGILPRYSSASSAGRDYLTGFGHLIVVPEEFTESSWIKDSKEWNAILKLRAFSESARLTVGECFPVSPHEKQRPQPVPVFFWLFPLGWGLSALAILITKPRRAFSYMILLTLAGLLTALPAGWAIKKQWHRGAIAITRVVIVPSGEGLVDSHIQLPRTGVWDLSGLKASLWGASVTLGREAEGRLSPGGETRAEWRHRNDSSESALASSDKPSLRMIGWISKSAIRRSLGKYHTGDSIGRWVKGRWEVLEDKEGALHWKKVADCPRWLRDERDWCLQLTRLAPEQPWLFGRGKLPEMELRLEGHPENWVIWARPLLKEGKS